MARSHRNFFEKALFSIVFKCRACGVRTGEKHRFFSHFGKHAQCPRCGTKNLEKRSSRDKIDRVLKSPISMLQAALGGHLYHCTFCRIQFYDLRGRKHPSVDEVANLAG